MKLKGRIIIGIGAVLLLAAVLFWHFCCRPTRIAFVNYQITTLGQISKSNSSRFIRIREVGLDNLKQLRRCDMVMMFGLMGTLIPMGPALVGLSTGDIASMAYNMQVAFATTVVGLFSSAVGFAVQQKKRRWYVEEMNQLVFVAELLKEKHSGQ